MPCPAQTLKDDVTNQTDDDAARTVAKMDDGKLLPTPHIENSGVGDDGNNAAIVLYFHYLSATDLGKIRTNTLFTGLEVGVNC